LIDIGIGRAVHKMQIEIVPAIPLRSIAGISMQIFNAITGSPPRRVFAWIFAHMLNRLSTISNKADTNGKYCHISGGGNGGAILPLEIVLVAVYAHCR